MNNLKIISVDDTYMNLIIIEEIAKDVGVEVMSFDDPFKALEYLQHNSVDLMFVDYMMPKMDGLELIKQALLLHNELIPIMVTAVSDD